MKSGVVELDSEDTVVDKLIEQYPTEGIYCKNNVFLTEKQVDAPKNDQELKVLDPGKMSLSWLENGLEGPYTYRYIDATDQAQLDLNTEVDPYFFVKWCEMSYSEATWERKSLIGHP